MKEICVEIPNTDNMNYAELSEVAKIIHSKILSLVGSDASDEHC